MGDNRAGIVLPSRANSFRGGNWPPGGRPVRASDRARARRQSRVVEILRALSLLFGPTPKIIFFPVMIMWFGVGPGSKIAMGAISCFFPIALSTAAGMRQIDKVLIRVGHSFRANAWQ